MRKIKLAWIPAVLLCAGIALGQISQPNHLPHKDLIFAQLAAGGIWETQITVTNRGARQWRGLFHFYSGVGLEWNPYVNGVQLTRGLLAVSINSNAAATYKVTVPGPAVEVGFIIAVANDAEVDNFIEGNLTWYVKDGTAVTDAIGVLPSSPFMATTIPFENFNSVSLALANTDAEQRAAHITMKLYSESGARVGGTLSLDLAGREHLPRYLREIFTGVTLNRGRVDIESNVPVSGVALIQTGSQWSSLPLDSTTRTYVLEWTGGHDNPFNQLVLWTGGLFVNGYVEMRLAGDPAWGLYAVSGQMADGELQLHFGGYWEAHEYFGYIKSNGTIALGQQSFTGTWYRAWPSTAGGYETGTFIASLAP